MSGRVEFFVEAEDAKAYQLHALLSVLGYEPARVLLVEQDRVRWAVLVMQRRFGLSSIECKLLAALLAGGDVDRLELGRPTASWYIHTLLSNSGSADVGELLATARSSVVWPDREEDIDDRSTSGP